MEHGESELREAAEYLRDNVALRRALGVADGDLLEPRFLGTGEHNRNFRFHHSAGGREYVLRVNVAPQPFHRNQVAYEYAALEALAPCGRTPQPLYLDCSPTALGKGVLVISFCEGDQLDFDALRPGDLRCAAQLMADVHAVEVSQECALHRPLDPLRTLFEECLQRFAAYRASAFEDARITKWAETLIAAARPLLDVPCPASDRSHIVNTETLPSHFLIPKAAAREAAAAPDGARAGRFCAAPGSFVDWERPLVGEVAQDVAYFVAPTTTFWDSDVLFPFAEVEDFVEAYWRAVDGRFERGNFDERFRAYRMMTALRSVTWCCKALIAYSGADAAAPAASPAGGATAPYTTAKTARKLPVYLSDDFMEMLAAECFGL